MALRWPVPGFLRPFRLQSVLFEATPRCNLSCAHCYNVWKGAGPSGGELDTAGARALVTRAIRQSRCEVFVFTGGEPCLRKDLEELVALARSLGPEVVLISNGTLLDEGRILGLLRAGVGLFELPLHGGESSLHDEALGRPGSFGKVTRAAVDILHHGGSLALVFVGTRATMPHWPAALELGIALGCRAFLLNRWNAGGASLASPLDLLPTVKQVRQALEVAQEAVARHGIAVSASIPIPPCLLDTTPYPGVGFGFCGAGTARSYTTLDPLGRVRPCNHATTILGDLHRNSLKRLFRGRAMAAFREARPAFCRDCPHEAACLGGCKAAAQQCSGDLEACEPFLAANLDLARRQVHAWNHPPS